MTEPQSESVEAPPPAPQPAPEPAPTAAERAAAISSSTNELMRTVLRVAWLSIGLGVALEVLVLTVAAYSGTQGSSPKPFVADLAHKVSWSFLVCVGLAFGTAAGKTRSAVMGLLGLISAPVAFAVARSLHKGVAAAMGLAGTVAAGPSPLLIALLKAIEFGFLGAALGRLGKGARGSLGSYVALGLLTGLVFGGTILGVTVAAGAKADLVSLLSRGINEVLFPLGCSLVLYAADAIGKRLAPG
ncbi:MAG TPA: hypothetical protein VNJ70_19335 [Thermoanaerobaculia bacterium]|nr:hypothetical protein [Thermoanaerobaculia bacterium]